MPAPAGVDGLIDLVGGDSMRSVTGLIKDSRQLISVADEAVAAVESGRTTSKVGIAFAA